MVHCYERTGIGSPPVWDTDISSYRNSDSGGLGPALERKEEGDVCEAISGGQRFEW